MISSAKGDLTHTLTSLLDRQRGRREKRGTSTLPIKRKGPEDKWLGRRSLDCDSVQGLFDSSLSSSIPFPFSMYAFYSFDDAVDTGLV